MNKTERKISKCGFIALVGRPNVGKSTLLNQILQSKVSIVTSKPQTTRDRILGIKTTNDIQAIYVDTPGLHSGEKRTINKLMNRTAINAAGDVDIVVFVIDGLHWCDEDQLILDRLSNISVPIILAINKIDKLSNREELLPYIGQLNTKISFSHIIPLSALKGENVTNLEQVINELLPESDQLYPEDQLSDRSDRFLAAEMLREQLMTRLSQELPYSLAVEIEKFEKMNNVRHINALIWVERDSQKAIVIGKKGETLKMIAKEARKEMERVFGEKVFLECWVKVGQGWPDDNKALRRFGYDMD